jgi:hypothetical protein
MGLDAVVYRNPEKLRIFIQGSAYEIDEITGEVLFASATTNMVIAEQVRFGNASEIAYLKNIIADYLDPIKSIIENKILYSASHSGDVIFLTELGILEHEMSFLKKTGIPELQNFLDGLAKLIAAAYSENNPIVFV